MLSGLQRNVEHFYIEDMPKHISDPDNSMFCIISHEDEVYMFAKKTQKILQDRHIVVMNVKPHMTTFDHGSLETLSPLNTVVNIDGKPNCCPSIILTYLGSRLAMECSAFRTSSAGNAETVH